MVVSVFSLFLIIFLLLLFTIIGGWGTIICHFSFCFCFLFLYFGLFQMLNVYVSKYESGGQLWPVVHNSTIFSLVFMQIISLGVFGLRKSPVASGFTIPLFIGTLLFYEYCRQRFLPIFRNHAAEVMI